MKKHMKNLFLGLSTILFVAITSINVSEASVHVIEEEAGQRLPCVSPSQCDSGNGLNYGDHVIPSGSFWESDERVCCGVASIQIGRKRQL